MEKIIEENTESNKGGRNMRQSPEFENFYRFIHEHELRAEASLIFNELWKVIGAPKKQRRRRKKKTVQ